MQHEMLFAGSAWRKCTVPWAHPFHFPVWKSACWKTPQERWGARIYTAACSWMGDLPLNLVSCLPLPFGVLVKSEHPWTNLLPWLCSFYGFFFHICKIQGLVLGFGCSLKQVYKWVKFLWTNLVESAKIFYLHTGRWFLLIPPSCSRLLIPSPASPGG